MFLLKARQHSDPSRWIVAVTLFFISIALTGCGTPFSFTVKDRADTPLAGATVIFEPESRVFLKMGTTAKVETDTQGKGRVAFEVNQQPAKLTVAYQGFLYCSREEFPHPARADSGQRRQIVRATYCGQDQNFRGVRGKDLWEVVVEMWCDDERN